MYNYTKQTHNWMAAAAAEYIEWGSSRSSIESPSLVLLVGFCVALWQRGVLARFPHLPSLAHPLIHHRLSLLIQSQFRRAQPLALSLSTLYSPWRVPAHGRTGRREVVAAATAAAVVAGFSATELKDDQSSLLFSFFFSSSSQKKQNTPKSIADERVDRKGEEREDGKFIRRAKK